MRSRRYKKKGPVRSKKVVYDGITFQSGLEKYMYIALKKAKIKADYEGATYELIPSFNYDKSSYERQANGKRAPNTPNTCLLYTSPSPRDRTRSRMPSSA